MNRRMGLIASLGLGCSTASPATDGGTETATTGGPDSGNAETTADANDDTGPDTNPGDSSDDDPTGLDDSSEDTGPPGPTVGAGLWNVTMDIADPRWPDLPASVSSVQLTHEMTLFADAPPETASVELDFDGQVVVDDTAPFRFGEDGTGNPAATDLAIGTHTLSITALDAEGATLASGDFDFEVTGAGTLEKPAEHTTHRLWQTDSGTYVHRDDNGDFLDADGNLVISGSDVSEVDMGGGEVHLVVNGGGEGLAFAFIVALPDGFDPTVPYPLVVFLHHGAQSYRGTDNDGTPLNAPLLGGSRSLIAAPEQRTRFPSIVLVPQMRTVQNIDGVTHEWAAFSSISNDTGSFEAGPTPSVNAQPVFDAIDALEAGTLIVDGDTPSIDPARIYLSGHSMGGLGSWDFLGRFPDRWAAGVPMAGYSDHSTAPGLVDTPIWAFHHEIDCYNPSIGTQTMYGLITDDNGGARMRFTLLTFDTGGACDQAHFQTPGAAWNEEDGLFEWVFGQVNDRL